MSNRITVKDATRAMERLAHALGKSTGPAYTRDEATGKYTANVGVWQLDYAPMYGGVCITELMENGGENRPFGLGRMSPAQFVDCVNFALNVISIQRRDQENREHGHEQA